jgi:hypothetical protein
MGRLPAGSPSLAIYPFNLTPRHAAAISSRADRVLSKKYFSNPSALYSTVQAGQPPPPAGTTRHSSPCALAHTAHHYKRASFRAALPACLTHAPPGVNGRGNEPVALDLSLPGLNPPPGRVEETFPHQNLAGVLGAAAQSTSLSMAYLRFVFAVGCCSDGDAAGSCHSL